LRLPAGFFKLKCITIQLVTLRREGDSFADYRNLLNKVFRQDAERLRQPPERVSKNFLAALLNVRNTCTRQPDTSGKQSLGHPCFPAGLTDSLAKTEVEVIVRSHA
jgi:hypothetical protein